MKNTTKKLLAVTLAAATVMSAASCKKKEEDQTAKSRSGTKITEDMPWYEAKKYSVDIGIDRTRKLDNCDSRFAGSDGEYAYVYTSAQYSHDGRRLEQGDDVANVSMVNLKTGETEKIINIYKLLMDFEPYSVNFRDGSLEVVVSYWNDETWDIAYKEFLIDPKLEQIKGNRDLEGENFMRCSYFIDGYRLDIRDTFADEINIYLELDITAPDGTVKHQEIRNSEVRNLYHYMTVFPIGKGKVVIPVVEDNVFVYYELDLKSAKISKDNTKKYEWLKLETSDILFNGSDGNVYSIGCTGITKINMEKKSRDELVNFGWSDLDRYTAETIHTADFFDDRIILGSFDCDDTPFDFVEPDYDIGYRITVLTKVKNPHVGKTIMELYFPYGHVSHPIYDQIVKFNNENGKYFIEIADRYNRGHEVNYAGTEDDTQETYMNALSGVSGKLAADIMNGNGPDIIISYDFYVPVNYKDHLADLTPYVGKLSKDKYFANIIDLAKQDGKLYNMPLTVGIYGLLSDSSYAGSSGKGFTTSEYREFLKGPLNGKDALGTTQPYYFVTLFNNMKNEFIKNGKADFTGANFADIAEFVKDNVIDKYPPKDDSDDGASYGSYDWDDYYLVHKAVTTECNSYWGYFQDMERIDGDGSILGLPSPDGRGPAAIIPLSVSVSAHAVDVAACGEFVKMLLGDDTQQDLATVGGYFPVSRDAYHKVAGTALTYFNSVPVKADYDVGGGTGSKNRITYTQDHIDKIEKTISSCTSITRSDPDIDRILVEEMPAYFCGQKSLADVCKVAQDRVQKVLDERG